MARLPNRFEENDARQAAREQQRANAADREAQRRANQEYAQESRATGGYVPPIPAVAPAVSSPLFTPINVTGLTPVAPTPVQPAPVGPPAPDTSIPSWWIGNAITNPSDPNQQFANVANALLPTLAPEDQRTLANYLATNFGDVYGGYGNVNFGAAPTEITDAVRRQYLSPQRAQLALNLLERMKTASGSQNMGAGYDFLKNAVNLINQYAQDGALTRERYNQFTNAVSGLVQGAGRDITAYANLAQLFNLPNFSAGPLISNAPNARLYS